MRINMSGAREEVPEEIYVLAYTKPEVKTSKAGNTYYVGTATIQEGKFKGFAVKNSMLMFDYTIRDFLKSVGKPIDFDKDLDNGEIDFDLSEYVGVHFYARLKKKTGDYVGMEIARYLTKDEAELAGAGKGDVFDDAPATNHSRRRNRDEE